MPLVAGLLPRRPHVLSQSVPVSFQVDTDTVPGLSPDTSVFSCQYHSNSAPHLSSSTYNLFQKDKRVKPGNFHIIERTFRIRRASCRRGHLKG